MKYKRILLKLSGESLQGEQKYGISMEQARVYAQQIKEAQELGTEIGIVIGGGNIFRGLQGAKKGFDRVKGDQMGMLATIINSLALQAALIDEGVKCKVLTSICMEPPPITMPISMPRACASFICSAYTRSCSIEMPYFCSPCSDSPLNLSSILLYFIPHIFSILLQM